MNNELEFVNDNEELEFGSAYTSVDMDYSKAKNKPSINGVELVGNLTTEDLKIQAGGSDIELITELKPESIKEELKDNQVYNGNAIHDLARLFGKEIYYSEDTSIYLNEIEPGIYWTNQTSITAYSKRGLMLGGVKIKLLLPFFIVHQKWDAELEQDTLLLTAVKVDDNNGVCNCLVNKYTGNKLSSTSAFLYEDIIVSKLNQVIKGVKTFEALPETSVEPTTDTQLTNKAYVDSAIDSKITQALEGEY